MKLIELIERDMKVFRLDADHYKRNTHMHDLTEAPIQGMTDIVLGGFMQHLNQNEPDFNAECGVMKSVDLLTKLTENARKFRTHEILSAFNFDKNVIDAVLTGFINYVGTQQAVDYGIYARDLATV